MRKNLILYLVSFTLLLFVLFFFNKTFRESARYSSLTDRTATLYSGFRDLSKDIRSAATLNPSLAKANGAYKDLFMTDSLQIISQLDLLKNTVKDSINIRIVAELDERVRPEISWLLRSDVVDSMVQQRATGHLSSLLTIDSLMNQGIHRANVLLDQQKTELHHAIRQLRVWMIIFVILSAILLGYTTWDLFRQRSKTQKKEIELSQTLKEISDYKFALDESSIVAITDQKGVIKHANDNFCKISKYSREELIGQDHRIINSGYHSKEFIRNIWVTIANGRIWKGELKNKAKDGTIYWVDTTIVPFLDDKGKPYQYVAIRSDITERKLAEENLQKSLKEIADYKYALEESSIVAITDQKGIIKYANDNFCKISKYSREELIGQDHRIINSGYHSKEFIRNIWVTIANGRIWKGELKNKAKDGTIYWVDTTIVPFLDDKGKPYQYVAIRSDITERKKTEQELIKSEREVSELNKDLEEKIIQRTIELRRTSEEMEAFSYSVSHDLRAPLRAIIGYSAILDEDYGDKLGPDAKEVIEVIKSSTEKMGKLIDDLLDFSRIGKKEIFKTSVKPNPMLNEVIQEITSHAGNDQNICWDIKSLPPMDADIAMIRQVWVNLISNAIKYSRNNPKPVIEIGSFDKNDQQVFYVKDNGAGFDEQYMNKLFKVFQRLHDVDEFEGTGVGLALVERIISKHGGKVWAQGKENEGACFYFSLPVNQTQIYES